MSEDLKPDSGHTIRLIIEMSDLEKRARKLTDFIGNHPFFPNISLEQQHLMKVQNDLMWQLLEILDKRLILMVSADDYQAIKSIIKDATESQS